MNLCALSVALQSTARKNGPRVSTGEQMKVYKAWVCVLCLIAMS